MEKLYDVLSIVFVRLDLFPSGVSFLDSVGHSSVGWYVPPFICAFVHPIISF